VSAVRHRARDGPASAGQKGVPNPNQRQREANDLATTGREKIDREKIVPAPKGREKKGLAINDRGKTDRVPKLRAKKDLATNVPEMKDHATIVHDPRHQTPQNHVARNRVQPKAAAVSLAPNDLPRRPLPSKSPNHPRSQLPLIAR
jgi:hypothetical protein